MLGLLSDGFGGGQCRNHTRVDTLVGFQVVQKCPDIVHLLLNDSTGAILTQPVCAPGLRPALSSFARQSCGAASTTPQPVWC